MDKEKLFRFAPLDSQKAKEVLLPILPGYLEEDTLVYYSDGKVYLRSDAAIRIVQDLGYSLAGLAKWVPKKWRDGVYRMIARRRYKYGERFASCPLPPVEWKDRFIN